MPHGDPTSAAIELLSGIAREPHDVLPELLTELHRIAHGQMKGQSNDHTLQTTALVNEAAIRILNIEGFAFTDREHVLRVATRAMKQILIDYARSKGALKRRPSGSRVSLEHAYARDEHNGDFEELSLALDRLRSLDAKAVEVVELRYFLELTFAQISEAQHRPIDEIKKDWRIARAWLRKELSHES